MHPWILTVCSSELVSRGTSKMTFNSKCERSIFALSKRTLFFLGTQRKSCRKPQDVLQRLPKLVRTSWLQGEGGRAPPSCLGGCLLTARALLAVAALS